MRTSLFAMTAAALLTSTAAMADSIDFSTPVTTSPTEAPGVWYTDRYAPSGFQASGGQLIETIAGSDYQGPGSFYNTQGRSYDLGAGTKVLSIDLTVDAAWANTDKRWAGFWGVGVDSGGVVQDYPIVEFITTGGQGQFRGWDTLSDTGGWINIGSAFSIGSGGVYNLGIELANGVFNYSTDTGTASIGAYGSTSIKSVILQGYNSGSDYSIAWDNLQSAVPEPSSWAMMVAGFGALGVAMRRRKAQVRFA